MSKRFIQAQITTYSGGWGGGALVGNAMARYNNPLEYTIELDDFSFWIDTSVITAVQEDIDAGGDGHLTDNEIQNADSQAWIALEMGHAFPGNLQLPDQNLFSLVTNPFRSIFGTEPSEEIGSFFSEGSFVSMAYGFLAMTAGNRPEDFPESEGYIYEYEVLEDTGLAYFNHNFPYYTRSGHIAARNGL